MIITGAGTASASTTTATDIWTLWATRNVTSPCAIIWNQWVGSATSAAMTAGSSTTWIRWNEQAIGGIAFGSRGSQAVHHVPDRRISEEERKRWAEREALLKKQRDEAEAARRTAEERAEKLLASILSPQQRDDLKNKRCFYLYSGGKKYRIDRGTHGNVKRVDPVNDEVIESFCIQPGGVPVPDSMAAQKLLLETDPDKFREIANVSRIRATG